MVSKLISAPLASLINCSFTTGIFPDRLKCAKIIPILNNGDNSLITNYRPISVLNVFSKIYEKVLVDRLNCFVIKNDILYKYQFGFRKNYSTYMALLSFMDTVTDAVDANKIVAGLFIDLSKAFDTINHDILIKKLHNYGVRGIALQLLSNYLSNRMQCVTFNGCTSDFLSITCGVPQGSVLGPLLFLLYINDIHKSSTLLKFILFADDTTILFSAQSLTELTSKLNSELKFVADWFRANKLSLNIVKTNYIIFRHSVVNTSTFPI